MSMFPEGDVPLVTDDEARLLKKWNGQLVTAHGAVGSVPFPEGTVPLPGDTPERSTQKINAIKDAI